MIERRHVEPARAEPDVRGREEVEVLTRCIPHRRDRIRHAVRELMRLTRLGVVDWPAPPGAEPGRMRVQRPQKGEGSRMRKRHEPEQIVRKLREADALLSAGGSDNRRCVPPTGGERGDVPSVAEAVQRHGDLDAEAAEEDRGRPGGGHRHPEGGR